ncbi:HP0729 family protein [Campylobacter coli]|nr:ATP-binding protein [Campylobacter coli]
MQNLLILYNPYYQQDVIKLHLEILLDKGQVAFGKIKSKLKEPLSYERNENKISHNQKLSEIYKNTSADNPLQLFLSDYANLFVAKVVKISKEVDKNIIPKYYQEKNLEVEDYFLITDLRELVRENFTLIRDKFLANFTTENNHTYAIYGNNYSYPLVVKQKEEINYFYDEINKYYLSVYKNQEYLKMQENFIQFIFGKKFFYMLHPDSINNLILAELELQQNLENPLYDFTSIIVKYSKTIEYEIYDFAKKIFTKLIKQNSHLSSISYSIQGKEFNFKQFFINKPNLGTIKFLLKNREIQELLDRDVKGFINYEFNKTLDEFQTIRNHAVHAKSPTLEQTLKIRNLILGIENTSILKRVLEYKFKQKG